MRSATEPACGVDLEAGTSSVTVSYRLGFGADYTGTDTITVYPTEGAQLSHGLGDLLFTQTAGAFSRVSDFGTLYAWQP